jgi:pSer/pThr/pTyr-binding forkhead associated (FHA) protein
LALSLRLEPRDGPAFNRDVSGEAVVLGRSSKADVVLADRFLSRLHARLFLRDGAWFVEDLGSRNTTFLNDRPVAGPVPVRPGDVIRLAESRVVIEAPGVPASADTRDGLTGSSDENLPGRRPGGERRRGIVRRPPEAAERAAPHAGRSDHARSAARADPRPRVLPARAGGRGHLPAA